LDKQYQKENKINVLFSKRPIEAKEKELVLYEDYTGWNNFGFRIRCKFEIGKLHSYDSFKSDILFGFLYIQKDDSLQIARKYTSLSSIFLENDITLSKKDIPDFFTMLPSMQAYRKLVSHYGVKQANIILLQINDVVVKKQKSKYSDWLKKVTQTKVFKLGFMRNSEPFFAYHNAESILNGLKEEKFDNISKRLYLSFKLDAFSNAHKLDLKYENNSLIPKRINVLIGKNGVGKSQALKFFCRSALQYTSEKAILIDKTNSNGRPMINRLLAIGTPGETSTTFPNERIKSQKLYYRRLHLTRNGKTKATRSTVELLVQLARLDEFIGKQYRWDIFLESLGKVLDIKKIVLKLENNTYYFLEELKWNKGEQHTLELWSKLDYTTEPLFNYDDRYYPLSSGQLTFFKFALLASLYIDNGSFVLMDEPETHLHPNYISNFIDLLDFLLEKTGSFALLATHSTYLVREISREQVHVFKLDEENKINIISPRLRTFGASIDRISEFVFEDNIENRLIDKIIERISDKEFKDIDEEIGNEISLPSLMAIKRYLKKGHK